MLRNADGTWVEALRLDETHRTAEIDVGGHGSVDLDLMTLLGG